MTASYKYLYKKEHVIASAATQERSAAIPLKGEQRTAEALAVHSQRPCHACFAAWALTRIEAFTRPYSTSPSEALLYRSPVGAQDRSARLRRGKDSAQASHPRGAEERAHTCAHETERSSGAVFLSPLRGSTYLRLLTPTADAVGYGMSPLRGCGGADSPSCPRRRGMCRA
jgi:hypothetical protein